jgi:hypothetical protein
MSIVIELLRSDAMTMTLDVELPDDLARFRLPAAVNERWQMLLDQQDAGQPLTPKERDEAEGLTNLADFLTLLRLRAERLAS